MPPLGKVKRAAESFDYLSGLTRLRALTAIRAEAPIAVEDIAEKIGQSHSATSHQLGMLIAASIVTSERRGRHILYSMSNTLEGQRVQRLMEAANL